MFNRRVLLLVLTGVYFSTQSSAQRIDNSSTFKTIKGDCYFRLHYDNDYFTRTDRYYTQGIELELVSPFLKSNPLSRLLIRPAQTHIQYGITIDHSAYTPTSISTDQILKGDRPFAACLSIKSFAMSTDSSRHQRLSTAFILGVIGPGAGAKEMQTTIHRWLDNPLPLGWQNQIQNDIILNYQLNFEKKLISIRDMFLLNTASEIRIGTLNDKISEGFNFRIGHFINPYQYSSNQKTRIKKLNYYLYAQPIISLIGYDASLQGGLFNHNSPYTIPTSNVSRIAFQSDYGIVLTVHALYLEYCQSFLTKEFNTGNFHRWGGIRIGLIF